MSNIYWMNTIRRKQNTGNSKKYHDYCIEVLGTGYFEESRTLPIQSLNLNDPNFSYGDIHMWAGAQKNEIIDTKNTQWNPWGISENTSYLYRPIRDSESFQYVILRMKPTSTGQGLLNDLQTFVNWFTSNLGSAGQIIAPIDLPAVSGTDSQGNPRQWDTEGNSDFGFVNSFITDTALACYPYILENDGTTVKLTTYSEKAPNVVVANNQPGTENTKLRFSVPLTGYAWKLFNTSDMLTYCNKLASNINNYTLKLPNPSGIEFGFLCIFRGSRNSNWTPRRHILWFLNRVTNIDTTNDWTHAQLS